jgi:hypothetical protein
MLQVLHSCTYLLFFIRRHHHQFSICLLQLLFLLLQLLASVVASVLAAHVCHLCCSATNCHLLLPLFCSSRLLASVVAEDPIKQAWLLASVTPPAQQLPDILLLLSLAAAAAGADAAHLNPAAACICCS